MISKTFRKDEANVRRVGRVGKGSPVNLFLILIFWLKIKMCSLVKSSKLKNLVKLSTPV